jgi:hypothetical protein
MLMSKKLNKEELIAVKKRNLHISKAVTFLKICQFLMVCAIFYNLFIKPGL